MAGDPEQDAGKEPRGRSHSVDPPMRMSCRRDASMPRPLLAGCSALFGGALRRFRERAHASGSKGGLPRRLEPLVAVGIRGGASDHIEGELSRYVASIAALG